MPEMAKDKRLDPNSTEMQDYVRDVMEYKVQFETESVQVWKKSMDYWDLFLAIQADMRDPVDEQWRSDVFIPLPFSTTRTKAAHTVELLGNTEPVWQVEATRENGAWYEQSKHIERLLDYTHRMNSWRKFLYKMAVARSVQGTAFFKVVWKRRATNYTFYPSGADVRDFLETLQKVKMQTGGLNVPDWMTDPEGFEKWRNMVNLAGGGAKWPQVPAAPPLGPTPAEVVEYEGPVFQYLPMWTVRLDPMIDEIADQPIIIHRLVKPRDYVLDRADDLPPGKSELPYYKANVLAALEGWNGEALEKEENELAAKLGLNPAKNQHPLYENSVELLEVWSSGYKFKYVTILNGKQVINKRPFERPLLTTTPNIFALRNIIVPGFFFGLSDYQEPEKLFTETNTFRRVRMDGALLSTLPVFVKQAGVNLTEEFKKLRPGLVITLPTKDAISSLISHALPADAYREPPEMKADIEDATEVYAGDKGAPATIGRVTGIEYEGRSKQTALKRKIDACLIEEELLRLPHVILSMFAQLGPAEMRKEIGGDPDALVDVKRQDLIKALDYRFRFRGATKNINPSLQVQQITQAVSQFRDALTISERRYALQLIMELLDIRGYSKVLTADGEQQLKQAEASQLMAGQQQNTQAGNAAEAAGVGVPGSIGPGEAGAAGLGSILGGQ